MTTEIIEGESRELTVVEPRRLSLASTPVDMIGLASEMATALKDIVERQKLYAVIQGRKYPQVEAWMTIARMDNVVARESEHPIRHEDGSYEAFVELVRLSDGMVIGRASALCGTPDDAPWGGAPATQYRAAQPPRAEPARRSMAVTRATSRAFRQQYSWIMALAGYEPTPAEEMPSDDKPAPPAGVPVAPEVPHREEITGLLSLGTSNQSDGNLRETPEGWALGFNLTTGPREWVRVLVEDDMALALAGMNPKLTPGLPLKVYGPIAKVEDRVKDRIVRYRRVIAETITADAWSLPEPAAAEVQPSGQAQPSPEEDAELDGALDGALVLPLGQS